MKLAQLKALMELDLMTQKIGYIQNNPSFQQLVDLLGPVGEKFAKDFLEAYQGDITSYAKTNGQKGFQSLALAMLPERTLERMYKIRITPTIQQLVHTLTELVRFAFPTSGYKNGGAHVPDMSNDIWAHNEYRYQR